MSKLTDDQKKAVLKVLQPKYDTLTEAIYSAMEGLLPDTTPVVTPVTPPVTTPVADTTSIPFDTVPVAITGRNVTFPVDPRIAVEKVLLQLANTVGYNVVKVVVDPANAKQVIATVDQDIANPANWVGKKATFRANPVYQAPTKVPVVTPVTPVTPVTTPVTTMPATTGGVTIDSTLNSRGGKKGKIFFNGGMGPGAPTYLPGRCGTNYGMISESEIKELVAMGVEEIRHGFLAARVLQPGGKSILYRGTNATGDPHQFEAMLQVGKWCKQYGLKIMWDMHNYGEFINADNEANATIYDLDTWVRDWTAIITALKADADTWFATSRFDTMNEWKAQFTAAQLVAAFQKLLNAVGVLSEDKVFVFEGTYWSSCINWVSNVGKEYATLKHPVDNKYIEFSAHLYLNQDAGGMYGEGDTLNANEGVTFDNIGIVRITSFAKWLKQYGFSGSIGECMVPGDCPQLLRGMRNLMLFCITNGINMYLFCWTGWAANSVHDLKSTRNVPMLNLAKEMLALK